MTRLPQLFRALAMLLAVITLSAGLAACGDDSSGDEAADPSSEEPTSEESDTAASGACEYVPGGPAAKDVAPPTADPTLSGPQTVKLQTSVHDFTLKLDADKAPCTVNSFLSLAEQGYYNDTTCHRMVNGGGLVILQCGDPTGSGSGGPGYSFADELDGSETYPAGTLAMANAGPDTNGSQFFMVFGDSQLPPSYTVFGSFGKADIAALKKVGEGGLAADGIAPKTEVKIKQVTAVN